MKDLHKYSDERLKRFIVAFSHLPIALYAPYDLDAPKRYKIILAVQDEFRSRHSKYVKYLREQLAEADRVYVKMEDTISVLGQRSNAVKKYLRDHPDKEIEQLIHYGRIETRVCKRCSKPICACIFVDRSGNEIKRGDAVEVANGEDPVQTRMVIEDNIWSLVDQAGGHWTRQLYYAPDRLKIIK